MWTLVYGSPNVTNTDYGQLGIRGSSLGTPPPRIGQATIYDTQTEIVYMFGGENSGGAKYNDIWAFDGISWTWIGGSNNTNQLAIIDEDLLNAPGSRDGASIAVLNNQLVVFGGYGLSQSLFTIYLNDVWTVELSPFTSAITSGIYELTSGISITSGFATSISSTTTSTTTTTTSNTGFFTSGNAEGKNAKKGLLFTMHSRNI